MSVFTRCQNLFDFAALLLCKEPSLPVSEWLCSPCRWDPVTWAILDSFLRDDFLCIDRLIAVVPHGLEYMAPLSKLLLADRTRTRLPSVGHG